jgi:hypothetical protein
MIEVRVRQQECVSLPQQRLEPTVLILYSYSAVRVGVYLVSPFLLDVLFFESQLVVSMSVV